jgi:hypothetical protein
LANRSTVAPRAAQPQLNRTLGVQYLGLNIRSSQIAGHSSGTPEVQQRRIKSMKSTAERERPSTKEESATLRIAECSFDLRNEVDFAQKAGGDGHDAVKVLHLEAVSVLSNQRSVVARR